MNPVFRWTFLLSLLWGGAILLLLFFLMRCVEAYDDRLVIRSWRGTEDIAFADIEWVSELINRKGPAYLCLKYRDKAHDDFRVVLCLPKKDHASEESALAGFIRQQVMNVRPEYSRDAEPSPWKIYAALILSGLVLHPLANTVTLVASEGQESVNITTQIQVYQVERFNKVLVGSSQVISPYHFVQTADGGSLIVGQAIPPGSSGYDVYVLKVNRSGDKEWDKYLSVSAGADEARHIIPASENGPERQCTVAAGIRSQLLQ